MQRLFTPCGDHLEVRAWAALGEHWKCYYICGEEHLCMPAGKRGHAVPEEAVYCDPIAVGEGA